MHVRVKTKPQLKHPVLLSSLNWQKTLTVRKREEEWWEREERDSKQVEEL